MSRILKGAELEASIVAWERERKNLKDQESWKDESSRSHVGERKERLGRNVFDTEAVRVWSRFRLGWIHIIMACVLCLALCPSSVSCVSVRPSNDDQLFPQGEVCLLLENSTSVSQRLESISIGRIVQFRFLPVSSFRNEGRNVLPLFGVYGSSQHTVESSRCRGGYWSGSAYSEDQASEGGASQLIHSNPVVFPSIDRYRVSLRWCSRPGTSPCSLRQQTATIGSDCSLGRDSTECRYTFRFNATRARGGNYSEFGFPRYTLVGSSTVERILEENIPSANVTLPCVYTVHRPLENEPSVSTPEETAASGISVAILSLGGVAVGFLQWYIRKRRRRTKAEQSFSLDAFDMDQIDGNSSFTALGNKVFNAIKHLSSRSAGAKLGTIFNSLRHSGLREASGQSRTNRVGGRFPLGYAQLGYDADRLQQIGALPRGSKQALPGRNISLEDVSLFEEGDTGDRLDRVSDQSLGPTEDTDGPCPSLEGKGSIVPVDIGLPVSKPHWIAERTVPRWVREPLLGHSSASDPEQKDIHLRATDGTLTLKVDESIRCGLSTAYRFLTLSRFLSLIPFSGQQNYPSQGAFASGASTYGNVIRAGAGTVFCSRYKTDARGLLAHVVLQVKRAAAVYADRSGVPSCNVRAAVSGYLRDRSLFTSCSTQQRAFCAQLGIFYLESYQDALPRGVSRTHVNVIKISLASLSRVQCLGVMSALDQPHTNPVILYYPTSTQCEYAPLFSATVPAGIAMFAEYCNKLSCQAFLYVDMSIVDSLNAQLEPAEVAKCYGCLRPAFGTVYVADPTEQGDDYEMELTLKTTSTQTTVELQVTDSETMFRKGGAICHSQLCKECPVETNDLRIQDLPLRRNAVICSDVGWLVVGYDNLSNPEPCIACRSECSLSEQRMLLERVLVSGPPVLFTVEVKVSSVIYASPGLNSVGHDFFDDGRTIVTNGFTIPGSAARAIYRSQDGFCVRALPRCAFPLHSLRIYDGIHNEYDWYDGCIDMTAWFCKRDTN